MEVADEAKGRVQWAQRKGGGRQGSSNEAYSKRFGGSGPTLPNSREQWALWGGDALLGDSWLQKGNTSSFLQLRHHFAHSPWEGLWEQCQLFAEQSKRQGMVTVYGTVTALWQPSRKRPAAGVASARRKVCYHSSMILVHGAGEWGLGPEQRNWDSL